MVLSPEVLVVVVIGGLLCGFLNTVASSGSAVSLPILMWVGLHAVDANATNRIPVLVGAITATAGLARHGTVPWRPALQAAVPVTVGAAIGALLSEVIPSHELRIFITGAIVMALILIVTKLKDLVSSARNGKVRMDWRAMILMFFVGVWTGFIVLDCATYMLLVLVVWANAQAVATVINKAPQRHHDASFHLNIWCANVSSGIVTGQLRGYPAGKTEVPAPDHIMEVFVEAITGKRLLTRALRK
jgi:uncharacterized membrane protein YfcA